MNFDRCLGWLAILIGLAGCGDGATTSLDAAVLQGEWTLLFQETEAGCTPTTGGSFEVRMDIEDVLTDILSGDVHVIGRWHVTADPDDGSVVNGVFQAGARGFELTLWGTELYEDSPRIVAQGSHDDRPGVSGEWSEVDGDVLYSGGCSGSVDGYRILSDSGRPR